MIPPVFIDSTVKDLGLFHTADSRALCRTVMVKHTTTKDFNHSLNLLIYTAIAIHTKSDNITLL